MVLVPRYPSKNRILPPGGDLPPVWEPLVQSFKHEALCLVSDGVLPDRMDRKEEGVLRRQPVITRIDLFQGTSMCCV